MMVPHGERIVRQMGSPNLAHSPKLRAHSFNRSSSCSSEIQVYTTIGAGLMFPSLYNLNAQNVHTKSSCRVQNVHKLRYQLKGGGGGGGGINESNVTNLDNV